MGLADGLLAVRASVLSLGPSEYELDLAGNQPNNDYELSKLLTFSNGKQVEGALLPDQCTEFVTMFFFSIKDSNNFAIFIKIRNKICSF